MHLRRNWLLGAIFDFSMAVIFDGWSSIGFFAFGVWMLVPAEWMGGPRDH